MKRLFYLLLLTSLSLPAKSQYKYLSSFNSSGVPSNISHEKITQRMLNNIAVSLPESKPVPVNHPQYIAGTDTDVKLHQTGEVWITFVAEGASYRNALGFYTYDLSKPPTSAPSASEITIIFPNLSTPGSGGDLSPGDQVYLGKFPANTGIGWVLIADGFKNGKVTDGLWILYSTPQFNPEANASLKYHNVLLDDSVEQKIVMGFEDVRRDLGCDNDFNDALFYITVSPNSAITKSNINTVTEASDGVGSGNDGGLESNGALALQMAQRQFHRITQAGEAVDYNKPTAKQVYRPTDVAQARLGSASLQAFIPANPIANAAAYVSTPTDLLAITNAKEVLSVDYFIDQQRKAAILGTYTENEVYNHTKTICDRLHGGSIVDIRTVTDNGQSWLLSQIQHPNLSNEYVICFSVAESGDAYLLEQHWAIDDFPKGKNYYNFQVWGYTAEMTLKLAQQIVSQFSIKNKISFGKHSVASPQVFVQSGYYNQGFLYLTIQNNKQATSLTLTADIARTETVARKEQWMWQTPLTGLFSETIKVPINQLFDTGIALSNPTDPTNDVLYLADSPWAVDMPANKGSIDLFTVTNNDVGTNQGAYQLERNAFFKGSVIQEVSLFKFLKPAAVPTSMTAFTGLTFEGQGKGIVEVILTKKSIQNSEEQFRAEVKLSAEKQTITIPYSDFRSAKHRSFVADDLTAVVFSFVGNGNSSRDFELGVSNLQFVKSLDTATPERPVIDLNVFPNPTTESARMSLLLATAADMQVSVLDLAGHLIWRTVQAGQVGQNEIDLPVQNLTTGIYICQLRVNGQQASRKLLVQR